MSVGSSGGSQRRSSTAVDVTIATRRESSPMIGELDLPSYARGVVIVPALGLFGVKRAQGTRVVEAVRRFAEVGTLVVDLLSSSEREDAGEPSTPRGGGVERGPRSAPDGAWIEKLAMRLNAVTDWLATHETARHLRLGYLADDLAGAAAVVTASGRSEARAMVLVDARLDLAGTAIEALRTPTLLLVGAMNDDVLAANRSARGRLRGTSELATVPSEGAVLPPSSEEEVARRASEWLAQHFG